MEELKEEEDKRCGERVEGLEEEEAKRKTEGGYDGKEGKLGGGGRYLNGGIKKG